MMGELEAMTALVRRQGPAVGSVAGVGVGAGEDVGAVAVADAGVGAGEAVGVGVAVGRAVRTSIVAVNVIDLFLSMAIWGTTTTVRLAG